MNNYVAVLGKNNKVSYFEKETYDALSVNVKLSSSKAAWFQADKPSMKLAEQALRYDPWQGIKDSE